MKKRITGREMTTKDWHEWDKQPLRKRGIKEWLWTWSGVLLLIALIVIILTTKW